MHVWVCRKDDIFRQRRLNHSRVGGGIAFRRVYPARAYCYNLAVSFTGLAECKLQHFLRTPDDTEVTEGDTAVLLCQVGNQIGQVQWTKDGLTLGKF